MQEGAKVLEPLGTAFVCNEDGYILTTSHIINLTKKYFVIQAKDINQFSKITEEGILNSIEVTINQYDTSKDIALLKIKNLDSVNITFDTSSLISVDNIDVGSDVYYLGFPFINFGFHNLSMSKTIISSKIILRDGRKQYQIDTLLHEGNSGGPLIDMQTNKIIGIISGTFDPLKNIGGKNVQNGRIMKEITSISYAIPIEYGIALLKEEEKYEQLTI